MTVPIGRQFSVYLERYTRAGGLVVTAASAAIGAATSGADAGRLLFRRPLVCARPAHASMADAAAINVDDYCQHLPAIGKC